MIEAGEGPSFANSPDGSEDSDGSLSNTPRTVVRRSPDVAREDRTDLYAILDAGFFCHLAAIDDFGPRIVPTLYGRAGDKVYIHGSFLSTTLRAALDGSPVCMSVTHVDGVVLARSAFAHAVHYRSAIIFGSLHPVVDPEERLAGLRAMSEQLVSDRWKEVRQPSRKELTGTAVCALSLDEASVKVRTGNPQDAHDDLSLDVWAGVLPLDSTWGVPRADSALRKDIPLPDHVKRLIGQPAFQPKPRGGDRRSV